MSWNAVGHRIGCPSRSRPGRTRDTPPRTNLARAAGRGGSGSRRSPAGPDQVAVPPARCRGRSARGPRASSTALQKASRSARGVSGGRVERLGSNPASLPGGTIRMVSTPAGLRSPSDGLQPAAEVRPAARVTLARCATGRPPAVAAGRGRAATSSRSRDLADQAADLRDDARTTRPGATAARDRDHPDNRPTSEHQPKPRGEFVVPRVEDDRVGPAVSDSASFWCICSSGPSRAGPGPRRGTSAAGIAVRSCQATILPTDSQSR